MKNKESENDLIKTALSNDLLEAVVKTAKRSTIRTFRTGAIVFDKNMNIVSKGCSHIPDGKAANNKRSNHAEDHALDLISHIKDKSDLSILIYTLNRKGQKPATSSRPCADCAERLANAGLNEVYYLERDNSGEWLLNREKPDMIKARTYRRGRKRYG